VSERGAVFVVSGPSGAGKSTLLRHALAADPRLRFSVSHTTRAPRSGELDGREYHFCSREAFQRMIDASEFLEWAEYNDNLYGTSRAAVSGPTGAGLDLILEVEVQGARQLRERLPGAVFVFILPPSLELLERRLRARGSEDETVIRKRLERAREEVRQVRMYDYVILNDRLEEAAAELAHVIGARRAERERVLPRLRGFEFD
jgi:guanylate kinase